MRHFVVWCRWPTSKCFRGNLISSMYFGSVVLVQKHSKWTLLNGEGVDRSLLNSHYSLAISGFRLDSGENKIFRASPNCLSQTCTDTGSGLWLCAQLYTCCLGENVRLFIHPGNEFVLCYHEVFSCWPHARAWALRQSSEVSSSVVSSRDLRRPSITDKHPVTTR